MNWYECFIYAKVSYLACVEWLSEDKNCANDGEFNTFIQWKAFNGKIISIEMDFLSFHLFHLSKEPERSWTWQDDIVPMYCNVVNSYIYMFGAL